VKVFVAALRWDARDDDLIQRLLLNRTERAYDLLGGIAQWPVHLSCGQCGASVKAPNKVKGADWIAWHGMREARHLSPVDTVTITVSEPNDLQKERQQ
jgi:hypothetical protein